LSFHKRLEGGGEYNNNEEYVPCFRFNYGYTDIKSNFQL
jgi:hypothetical protein